MKENNNQLIWIRVAAIGTFLLALLALVAFQAIIWGPTLIEIASVTWNDRPTL